MDGDDVDSHAWLLVRLIAGSLGFLGRVDLNKTDGPRLLSHVGALEVVDGGVGTLTQGASICSDGPRSRRILRR